MVYILKGISLFKQTKKYRIEFAKEQFKQLKEKRLLIPISLLKL